jgi:hypothetical protein
MRVVTGLFFFFFARRYLLVTVDDMHKWQMHERDKKSFVEAIIETHTLCHTYYHIEDTLSTWGNGALNPGLKSADFHSPFPSCFFFPSPLLIPCFLFLCN